MPVETTSNKKMGSLRGNFPKSFPDYWRNFIGSNVVYDARTQLSRKLHRACLAILSPLQQCCGNGVGLTVFVSAGACFATRECQRPLTPEVAGKMRGMFVTVRDSRTLPKLTTHLLVGSFRLRHIHRRLRSIIQLYFMITDLRIKAEVSGLLRMWDTR